MRFEVETSLYGPAPLLNEFKGIIHDFEVTRDKLSSIISDAEIKEYQDGGITMASKLSSVVQDINGVHQQFSEFETDYDNTKQQYTLLESRVHTVEVDVDGTKDDISRVEATADQAATDINSLTRTVNTMSSTISTVQTTMRNDYATKTYADNAASTAESNAATTAQSKADKALADAKADTVDKLKRYSTTQEMTSAIEQSASSIRSYVSESYATQANLDTAKKATITNDTLHYLATNADSGVTTSTSGWSTTPQSVTLAKRYLWTYHTYTYGDNSTKNTTPVITGVWGNTGNQGQKGDKGNKGDAGTGVSAVTTLYYASSSTSTPTAPTSKVTSTSTSTGAWTKAIPTLTGTYKYLYTCDQVEYDNNTVKWTTVVRDNAAVDLAIRMSSAEQKITADSIVSTVTSSASWQNLNTIVTQTAEGLESKVSSSDYNGATIASKINQAADSVTINAKHITLTGSDIAGRLNDSTATINAARIDLSGYVTVSDLSGSGTTTINGSNITTGKIQSANGDVYFDLANNVINASRLRDPKGQSNPQILEIEGSSLYLYPEGSKSNAASLWTTSQGVTYLTAGTTLNLRVGTARTSEGRIEITKGYFNIYAGDRTSGSLKIAQIYSDVSNNRVRVSNNLTVSDSVKVNGQLTVSGSKSRVVDTENYGNRLLYCYEMPSPMFGDIGCSQTDENGEAIIDIDDLFHETVSTAIEYQVFLQKEGDGDLYVKQKERAYFIVEGTPNLKFSWEVKVKQAGYEYERLDDMDLRDDVDRELNQSTDYFDIYKDEFEYIQEQEAILYEAA